jgi:hypothetical protein
MSSPSRLLRFLQDKAKALQMPLHGSLGQLRYETGGLLGEAIATGASGNELLRQLTVSVLGSRWLNNPDALVSRNEVGHWLNWQGLVGQAVEIGVLRGGFSAQILGTWEGARLTCVDPWREFPSDEYVDNANFSQGDHEKNFEETTRRLAGYGPRSRILRKTSQEGAGEFPNESLDFVYIDAQHHYEAVREDIRLWYPKVKRGGVLGGHDYLDGVVANSLFGVKRAVDEFAAEQGLKMIATREPVFKSWFLRKA